MTPVTRTAGSVRGRAAKRALRVVDVLPLGGKKRLAVVRVYDRTFVLGLGDKEVSVVSELDAEAGASHEIVPAGAVGKSGLRRAFEQIRARVAEGKPRPRQAESPSRPARKPAPARPAAAPGRVRLGNGRWLLG